MGWQWHQLDHIQIICTSLQTDNHARCSSWRPTNSVTASVHWRQDWSLVDKIFTYLLEKFSGTGSTRLLCCHAWALVKNDQYTLDSGQKFWVVLCLRSSLSHSWTKNKVNIANICTRGPHSLSCLRPRRDHDPCMLQTSAVGF